MLPKLNFNNKYFRVLMTIGHRLLEEQGPGRGPFYGLSELYLPENKRTKGESGGWRTGNALLLIPASVS